MKKIIFALLAIITGIFLFVVAVQKVGIALLLQTIFSLSFIAIVAISGATIAIILCSVFRWRVALKSYKLKYSFKKILSAFLGGFAISYLTPMPHLGGEPAQAFMLSSTKENDKTEIPWARIYASIIVDKFIDLCVSFLVLVVAVIFLIIKYPLSTFFRTTILSVLIGIVVVTVIMLRKKGFVVSLFDGLFSSDKNKKKKNGSDSKLVETIKETGDFFKLNNRYLYGTIFYSLLKQVFIFLRIWLILYFLGVHLEIIPLVIVTGVMFLVSVTPVPAAMGAFEISQVFAFELLGYGASAGGAFSIILRFFELFVTFIGMIFFVSFGFKHFIGKIINYSQRLGKKLNNEK